jgi:hypothetical protein
MSIGKIENKKLGAIGQNTELSEYGIYKYITTINRIGFSTV